MEMKANTTTSMTCPTCGNAVKRFGKHRNGLQRFRCLSCRKTFTEPHKAPFQVEDYLKDPRGLRAIRMLTEGCSIRSVERLTDIRRDTIIALLLIAGQRCEKLMDSLHDVPVTDVQADECWKLGIPLTQPTTTRRFGQWRITREPSRSSRSGFRPRTAVEPTWRVFGGQMAFDARIVRDRRLSWLVPVCSSAVAAVDSRPRRRAPFFRTHGSHW